MDHVKKEIRTFRFCIRTRQGRLGISTLLYCQGEEADDILSSTNISEADRIIYDKVIGKFKTYFQVCKNMICELARYRWKCANMELQDEMLWDKLVAGIRYKALYDKWQLQADLTLESAKKTTKRHELQGESP